MVTRARGAQMTEVLGLTPTELLQMRSDILQLFPDTCSILQLSWTSDGAGGGSESWGTATGGTSVPCRVDYLSGSEGVVAGAITPYQKAVVSMGWAVSLTPANRIQVGSSVFSVQAVNNGQSWKTVTEVTCELVPA